MLTIARGPMASRLYGIDPHDRADQVLQLARTCQDRANFNNVPVTLRFAVDCDYLPDAIPCIPSIAGIRSRPVRSASVRISERDQASLSRSTISLTAMPGRLTTSIRRPAAMIRTSAAPTGENSELAIHTSSGALSG